MSDGSDIEMHSALLKKQKKKMPKSPSEDILKGNEESKKPSTKIMLHQALKDLKSRKGTSLYAIKKYMNEKFSVDVNKINHILKKLIKAEVEAGTIVQTKGIGASGSFKLVTGKEKVQNKEAMVKKLAEKIKRSEEKSKKTKDMQEKPKAKSLEKKVKKKDGGTVKKKSSKVKAKEKTEGEKNMQDDSAQKSKQKASKAKSAKAVQTPAKKRAAMLKRKSIGSIIKPPKMRPKGKA